VRSLGLPRQPFVRLIDANRRDQRQHVYATFDELVDYCDLSANPVGELVLYVFGAATPARIAQSNAVCTALQLLEHWQDVDEDYGNGRIYLPAEDLERFGVAPGEFEGDAYARLMSFEIARARALLDEGAPLVGTLRGRARLAVAGYVGGGRAGLDALAAGSRKASKPARVAASLKTFARGRGTRRPPTSTAGTSHVRPARASTRGCGCCPPIAGPGCSRSTRSRAGSTTSPTGGSLPTTSSPHSSERGPSSPTSSRVTIPYSLPWPTLRRASRSRSPRSATSSTAPRWTRAAPSTRRSPSSSATAAASRARSGGSRSASSTA